MIIIVKKLFIITLVYFQTLILKIERYPDENLDEHFKGMSGKVITAEFILNGQKFLGLDGGPYFHFNEAISMTIECEDEENNN